MTIDVCKILDKCGVQANRSMFGVAQGVHSVKNRDVEGLIRTSYDAVKSDMGLSRCSHPLIDDIFCKAPNEKNIFHYAFFDAQKIKTSVNKFSLQNAQSPLSSLEAYFSTLGAMYHETRHFVQKLLIIKERGFDAALPKMAILLVPMERLGADFKKQIDKDFHRAFYEKAATVLPPTTPEEKTLVDKMVKSGVYSSFEDSSGNLTKEYKEDPAEIDALAYGHRKQEEAFDSIKTPEDRELEAKIGRIWGKKVA